VSRGLAGVAGVLMLCALATVSAVETTRIALPASLGFTVTNVSASTIGNPNPTSVSLTNISLSTSNRVRVSVKADSNFVPPSGTAIPASKVSWTTSSAVQGTGSSGTLSTSAYGQVFQSTPNKTSASISVTWTLAAPGTPLRAGTHTMTMRWKVEGF
jgi:hypothetical protein